MRDRSNATEAGMEIASGDLQVVARVVQLLRLLAVNETIDLV